MSFSSASLDRLKAAYPSTWQTESDTNVATYADTYLKYDSNKRVKEIKVQGAGCSTCSGGLGTYTYAYSTSTNTDPHPSSFDYNRWQTKTVETLPDGNTNTVYSNEAGQTMLSVFVDVASGNKWADYYQYDGAGRATLHATPSAVTLPSTLSTIDAYNDLLHDQSGNYEYLRDDRGVIELETYGGPTTTATSTTSGDAIGYLKSVSIKHGETAASTIKQEDLTYFLRSANGGTQFLLGTDTVYRTESSGGTGGQTTSYAYTWLTGSAQPTAITVTLPTVSTTQNGPNSADVMTTYFDAYGRPTYTKDGDGFITRSGYDSVTGAATSYIDDANTTTTTDEPSGWTTPSGDGLHLSTVIAADPLGRPITETDPLGNVTWIVYDDANHQTTVFPGWSATAGTTTGPIQIMREDRAHKYTETLTTSATAITTGSSSPSLVPIGVNTISSGNIQSLSRQYVNDAGQVVSSDQYFDLTGVTYSTAANIGTLNTNYYRTSTDYDSRGRLKRVISPTGTINWTVYDGLGRPISQWVGTDDTGFSNSDPSNGGTSPNNMKKVADYVYDAGAAGGDSHLTKLTLHPTSSSSDDRVTENYYDWRGRLIAEKSGVQASETDTSVQRQIAYSVLDNLGEATDSQSFDADGVSITRILEEGGSDTDGLPDAPSSSLRRSKATASYDEQGRVYRTDVYSVNASTGTVSSDSLHSETFYDHRGNVIKTASPGGVVMKDQYDGAGRIIKTFATDGGGDSGWSDADDVTGDAVLEQSEVLLDADGNAILTTVRQRNHDETTTGALGDASTTPKARVSYSATYYDSINRPTSSIDFGTNGGTLDGTGSGADLDANNDDVADRPSSVPSRSDAALRTDYGYNSQGSIETTTDPRGIVAKTYYDLMGRTVKTISAYVDGTPSDADDQTTLYGYDGSSHVTLLTADMPSGTVDQQTQYVYGITTGGGSAINSNDVLKEVRYPDKTAGTPGTTSALKQQYTYNGIGNAVTFTDQNGSVHTYGYDVLGRPTADAVTTLGTGVDGSVRRLETVYDTQGNASLFTGYNAASGGCVTSQVKDEFNGLGQLTAEYQSHAGSVVTSTTSAVRYAYTEMASGANHSRLKSMTYPDGRVLRYEYASGVDNNLSRVSYLADDASGSVGTHLEEYSYLGLGTIVDRAHPESSVDLSYVKRSGETATDGGDQYTGLDRFGRVIDQRWLNPSTGTAVDRFKYGYDRDSNVQYKDDQVTPGNSELYHASGASNAYDLLNRLTAFARGSLSDANTDGTPDTVATSSRSQSWSLDAVGNWNSVTTGTPAGSSTQSRTSNAGNQVTSLSSATSPTYDSNGNTKTLDDGKGLTYDAWNHVITAADPSSGPVQRTYGYDALGRRISETIGASGAKTDRFYSAAWQDIEERVGSVVKLQNVFSEAYIDAIVLQDRDPDRSAGALDTTFSSDGKATANLGTSGDAANAVAVQPWDQKVVLAGQTNYGGTGDFAVARFNADGSLDATFDSDGLLTVDFGGNDYAKSVQVLRDGRILVVGITDAGVSAPATKIAMLRLNADGSVDTTFNGDGNTDGKIIVDLGNWESAWGSALLPDGSDSFLVAGQTGGNFLLMKFNADGSADSAFGNTATDGLSTAPFYQGLTWTASLATTLAVDPADGDIVLAGFRNGTTTSEDVAVARFDSTGALDTSFDSDGLYTLDIDGVSGYEEIRTAVIQNDGKIVLGGYHGTTADADFTVLRLSAAGALDTSFSGDGIVTTEFQGPGSHDITEQVALQPDGAGGQRIVLCGYSTAGTFAILRYNANGTLDSTFDSDGKLSTDFVGTWDTANALAITPDGELVVAGWTGSNYYTGGDFAVSRYSLGKQRFYVQQDANYNVTAITDKSGVVLERYAYDPYGSVTYLRPDGSMQADSFSDFGWNLNWQGARKEAYTGLYYKRGRDVSSSEGRAIEPDLETYVDGMNMYQWLLSSPTNFTDPMGTEADSHSATIQPATSEPEIGFPENRDPISLPKGEDRIEIDPSEALKRLKLPPKTDLKRGCQDLFNALSGLVIWKCYLTKEEADKVRCADDEIRLEGVISGYVTPDPNYHGPQRNGIPTNDDGTVSPRIIGSGVVNYALRQPDGSYIFMNHGAGGGEGDPVVVVQRDFPLRPKKDAPPWTNLFCVACKKKAKDKCD